MEKLNNIEVFAFCVAEIMDTLYKAFPLPIELSAHRVAEYYGPSEEESQPRLVQPGDDDYQFLFHQGLHENAEIAHAAWEEYSENYHSIEGQPFKYWTDAQRETIRDRRVLATQASLIHAETIGFLLREGYINDVPRPNIEAEPHRRLLVLTSKGFAHLNKKFEDSTIRDEFQLRTAKKLFGAVKAGGEVASAGQMLVQALATFFS